jgi:hypothetical protein
VQGAEFISLVWRISTPCRSGVSEGQRSPAHGKGHEEGGRRPPEKPTTPLRTTGSAPLPVAALQIPVASPATAAPTNRQTGLSSRDNTSPPP